MSAQGVQWAAMVCLALAAALGPRKAGDVAAYLGTLMLCEGARAALPMGSGVHAIVIAKHALYLWPEAVALLGLVGLTTRQTWPMIAGPVLCLGSVIGLALAYPLGPERLSLAWAAIEGVAVLIGMAALVRHYGWGSAPATLSTLLTTILLAVVAVRWVTVFVVHAEDIWVGWPTVRVLSILRSAACLTALALFSWLSSRLSRL